MKLALSIVALAGLAVFLGVMIWHVTSPDLTAVIIVSFLLAAFDLFRSARDRHK